MKLVRKEECYFCFFGKYCKGVGVERFLSNEFGNCDLGFYCVLGVNILRFSFNFIGIGGVCLLGVYCFEEIFEFIGCFSGIFLNVL